MKTSWLRLICLSCILLSFVSVRAQSFEVTGRVFDSNKEPLPGATVRVKDANIGVATGVDGAYRISVPSENSILVISFVGTTPEEIVVGNRRVLDVTLYDSSIALNEVVAIGYGSVKKKDLTGAITSINEKDLNHGTVSPDRMLVGKVAGVQVTPSGGAPGSGSRIRIRGGASLTASNDPLIVLDGVPLENDGVAGSPSLLSTINPNDIESMNILKDASATAIYGSRASNGVIIITTKKASLGQPVRVNFSTQFSLSTIADKLDVLSANEIRDIVNNNPRSSDEYRSLLGTADTDWQDEIYQEAFGTDNNLSVSGSIKDVLPYSVSLGYLNEKGILKTGKMERMTASVNLNLRLFDNHLKIDVSVKGSKINNRFANTDAIQTAVSFDPTQPVKAQGFDKYGGYFTWLLPDGSLKTQAPTNPALLLDTYSNTSRVYRAITNAQIDYRFHFFEDMHAVLNLGYDYSDGEGLVQVPEWAPQMASRNGQYMEYASSKKNKLLEFYLNYTKDVPAIQSSFDVTAGYTYQDWLTHTDNFTDYSATGEEVDVPDFPFDETRVTLISAFGRLNYSLMDKYLLTATVRRDGSSRFHPDTRWGTFPSVALAWRLKEEFLKDADKVDELKLRVGYGQTGQQDIYQYYPYLSRYEVSSNVVQQQFGDKYYYMYRPSAYDSEIKWETTETWNAAVDFGFFDNRLSGSLDFYIKKTKDLLATVSVPAGSNFSNQLISNVGSLENKGFELTLNADLIRSKDWNWTASFNIAYNNNKVTKLTLVDSDDYEGIPQGWIFGSTGGTVQIHSVGYNTFSYYLYKQVYDENGRPLEGVYEDLNHDGRINSDDLYRTKSAEPKVTMGLSTSLSYKDWTLSTTLRGSFGNYVYNNMNSGLATYSNILSPSQAIMNAPRNVLESGFYLGQPLSDYYLENASFVKMDNLSLTYDFGMVFKEKIGITGTLMVQNVFTITKYSGIDPEIAGGVDRSFYPRPRIFMLGFNINY